MTPNESKEMVGVAEPELLAEIQSSHAADRDQFERWLAARSASRPEGIDPAAQARIAAQCLQRLPGVSVELHEEPHVGREGELEFRIGRWRVFHLRRALKVTFVDGVGLFFAFAGASGFPALCLGWFFVATVDLLSKFIHCFEGLEDQGEQAVFQALYEIQNRKAVSVQGSDVEPEGDQRVATLSATADGIHERVEAKMSLEEVRGILRDLRSREIVTERDGLWSISFW